jgi:methylenetetrahydrofolate--tRNA-(uracil-5-)-methyltransferase
MSYLPVHVIGAGLAGVEAAHQLALRGIPVRLHEMKKIRKSPAHQSDAFAELVCSNSLRCDSLENAVGLLKEELRRCGSLVMQAADATRVPAGSALAVDRSAFSEWLTQAIRTDPLIEVIDEEVTEIPDGFVILATGPLTSDALFKTLRQKTGLDTLYFFDAAAPIVDADSIDMTIAYRKSRYDKGEATYLNCPMTKAEYEAWYEELIRAECVVPKEFELKVFEGCMPFEEMARRGKETLLFGPMKPVGLEKPDGTRPYAVVQLRQDNLSASMYNVVGFQTHLTFPEQRRISG